MKDRHTEGEEIAYEAGRDRGYRDGLYDGSRCVHESLEFRLKDLQMRHDALLDQIVKTEMMKPPAPIIIKVSDSEQLPENEG